MQCYAGPAWYIRHQYDPLVLEQHHLFGELHEGMKDHDRRSAYMEKARYPRPSSGHSITRDRHEVRS